MADSTLLLRGLIEYRNVLERHLSQLNFDFQSLSLRWSRCSSVYEGEGADEFRHHWGITTDRFDHYLQRTRKIAQMLDDRIGYLRELERPDVGLP